jgi:hypothetical protein
VIRYSPPKNRNANFGKRARAIHRHAQRQRRAAPGNHAYRRLLEHGRGPALSQRACRGLGLWVRPDRRLRAVGGPALLVSAGWPDQPARGLLPEVTVRGVGHMLGALCDAVPAMASSLEPQGARLSGSASCPDHCAVRHSGSGRGRLRAPAAVTIVRRSRPGQRPRGARRYRRDCRMGAGRVVAARQPRLTGRCPVPGMTAARTASRQRRGRGPRWSRWRARVWW